MDVTCNQLEFVMLNTTSLNGLNQTLSNLTNQGPVFARHETFHPRYGWLKKGFDGVSQSRDIFNREDAPVVLGVGKNMVRAIRYWGLAFKVFEDDDQRRGCLRPTAFGEFLLSEPNGLDPFLENIATLWLLHWKLLSSPCQASAWFYTFNGFHRTQFSAGELIVAISEFVQEVFPNTRLAQSSIKKDVNCIIRMYGKPRDLTSIKEETIDSPFTELGLIKPGMEKDHYRFCIGPKLDLPDAIVVSSCLEFVDSAMLGAHTASLNSLLYSPGSPGQIFKLDEQSLYSAIERLSSKSDNVSVSETAGLIQMSFGENPASLAREIITDYYRGRTQ